MSKHTPGPWDVDYEGGGIMGRRALLKNENGKYVGYLYEAKTEDENLIAAAPELLEELKNMVVCFERFEDTHTTLVMEAARAAIAKATGDEE